jgi:hypothetical protein
MEDRTMAENLERVHNIYLDTQERPVDKVDEGDLIAWSSSSPGGLVDRVCLQTQGGGMAEVCWRGGLLLPGTVLHNVHIFKLQNVGNPGTREIPPKLSAFPRPNQNTNMLGIWNISGHKRIFSRFGANPGAALQIPLKEGGCECCLQYIEQNCFSCFLHIQ